MTKWYCEIDGEQQGPFDEIQMKDFISSGVVTNETLVWQGETGEPKKASETKLFLPDGIIPRLKRLSKNPAFISMVLGILAMVGFCFGPFIGLVAIIMGKNALADIKKGKFKGRTYAVTGIVTAVIAILIWPVLIFIGIKDYNEESRKDACAANMRAIVSALRNYANDNDKHFPPYYDVKGLEMLRAQGYISDLKRFVCPSTQAVPAEPGKPLLEENVSYVYNGSLDELDLEIPILWDKAVNHKNFGNIIHCNGRVEAVSGKHWQNRLKVEQKAGK